MLWEDERLKPCALVPAHPLPQRFPVVASPEAQALE